MKPFLIVLATFIFGVIMYFVINSMIRNAYSNECSDFEGFMTKRKRGNNGR